MNKPTTILIYLIAILALSTQATQAELVTVKEDGSGDYTSLSAAVNAIPADITGDPQEPYEIKITGTWNNPDTTGVTINNTTTDATNYIYIYTDSTARHNGVWDETKYRLVVGNYSSVLSIYEDYVRIEGLQIHGSLQANGIYVGDLSGEASAETQISYCIIKQSSANYGTGIVLGTNHTAKVWNNIIYDFYHQGIKSHVYNNSATYIVYNNTVIDTRQASFNLYGAPENTTVYAKNNISQGTGGGYSLVSGATTANNLSEDATSPDDAYDNLEVLFVDEANDDFRLSGKDTTAKDQGTNSVSPINFTDDIQGESRSWAGAGSAWDIGADEAIVSGIIIEGNVTIGAY